jgi:mono/diheme cytochrome c family protein
MTSTVRSCRRSLLASCLGTGAALFILLLLAPPPAFAEDEHSGITEYELACMPCHGIDGRGDGPRAKDLSKPPADLTRIAKANGGRFPAKTVADIIDGRSAVTGHGPRDMPVWGDRYRVQADESESARFIDRRARGQIAALVRYLESIQEK